MPFSKTPGVPSALTLLIASFAGCTGQLMPGLQADPSSPKDGETPVVEEIPPQPIIPGQVAESCSVDRPHPRRALRLSTDELLQTYRAIAPVPEAMLPDGFAASAPGKKPDASLAVARDFHESIDTVAQQLSRAIAAQPGLDCPVESFGSNEACTRTFLQKQAARFFRGGDSRASVESLYALVRDIAGRSGANTAMEYAVRALALSAQTLYNTEGLLLDDGADPKKPTALASGELASFLSYRITGGPPSVALLDELGKSTTPTPLELLAIIERHVDLKQRQQAATAFWAGLLNVADIPGLVRDPQKHADVTATRLAELQTETLAMVNAFAQKPDATWASAVKDAQTSAFAGDTGNPAFAAVGRPSLFLLPGVLASISNTDHTDIPRRGRFLLRQLFCEDVPSPPANLLQSLPPLGGKPTQRQRFERIEQESSCGGCHERVNHLGFALEAYDEMGIPRLQEEQAQAIQTESRHRIDGQPDLVFTDARDLLQQAATHPVAQECLALQVFRHFARRQERGTDDACLVRDILKAARDGNFNLQAMFTDTLIRTALAQRSN
jgi:Protein of unknown function (DUF1588)/Protein of unknown function (DUF1592)